MKYTSIALLVGMGMSAGMAHAEGIWIPSTSVTAIVTAVTDVHLGIAVGDSSVTVGPKVADGSKLVSATITNNGASELLAGEVGIGVGADNYIDKGGKASEWFFVTADKQHKIRLKQGAGVASNYWSISDTNKNVAKYGSTLARGSASQPLTLVADGTQSTVPGKYSLTLSSVYKQD